MKRVILDTNVYGKIIEQGDENLIANAVEKNLFAGKLLIYGNSVIRNEIRDVPKKIKTREANLRIALLNIYDRLVGNHKLEITSEVKGLANHYLLVYKKIGGVKNKIDILNDFLIIASATIKKLDIVYSEDNKTMLSEKARKSYLIVNEIKKLRTPNFENYNNFIKEIRRLLT